MIRPLVSLAVLVAAGQAACLEAQTVRLRRVDAREGRVAAGLVGRWRQSSWSLCTPVPRLGAEEIDPPIGELVFDADGGFSVTWVPFEVYHDYRGTFTTDVRAGAIELKRGQGNFTPSDFDGHGSFEVNGDVLVLRDVWFGTKTAKRKPDVCALTFARS